MKINSLKPTLFLDRDGTINVDMGKGYLNRPEDAKLIPGVANALLRARKLGFQIALITNQAGIAKGITPSAALPQIHARIEAMVCEQTRCAEFRFDDIRICPHHPDEGCRCRKPGTQNLEASIQKLSADVKRSFFVGDNTSDLICGNRMELTTILVRTGHGAESEKKLGQMTEAQPSAVVDSLAEAVEFAARCLGL